MWSIAQTFTAPCLYKRGPKKTQIYFYIIFRVYVDADEYQLPIYIDQAYESKFGLNKAIAAQMANHVIFILNPD